MHLLFSAALTHSSLPSEVLVEDWVRVESSHLSQSSGSYNTNEVHAERRSRLLPSAVCDDIVVHTVEQAEYENIPVSFEETNIVLESDDSALVEDQAEDIEITAMKDSGISASMNVSDESVLIGQILPSSTLDSLLSSTDNDAVISDKLSNTDIPQEIIQEDSDTPRDDANVEYSSSGMKVESVNISKMVVAGQTTNFELSKDHNTSFSSDALSIDITADTKSNEVVVTSEVTTDDPKLETETRVEVLPDGTFVTRKITKTIRKRMVAKSVLKKSEDGELTISSHDQNSNQVQKFLKLGSGTDRSDTEKSFNDQTSHIDSSATHFLTMTTADVDELEQTFTDDIPTALDVERKITVVQSQTTCIEGEDSSAESSLCRMASAPANQ